MGRVIKKGKLLPALSKHLRIIKLILREPGNKHSEDKVYDASVRTK